jgi:hypothetical protein
MVRIAIAIGFAAALCTTSPAAASDRQGVTAFAAFGQNFMFPGSLRIGWRDWEFIQLTPIFYGATKSFAISQHTYSSFGIGAGGNGETQGGFHAAVGFNYGLLGSLGVRGELAANVFLNSTTFAQGLIGVSYGF